MHTVHTYRIVHHLNLKKHTGYQGPQLLKVVTAFQQICMSKMHSAENIGHPTLERLWSDKNNMGIGHTGSGEE